MRQGQRVKAEGFGTGTVVDTRFLETLGFVGVLWDEQPPREYSFKNPANHLPGMLEPDTSEAVRWGQAEIEEKGPPGIRPAAG